MASAGPRTADCRRALRRWMHAPVTGPKTASSAFSASPARAIPVRPGIRIALQEAIPMIVVSVTAPVTGRVP